MLTKEMTAPAVVTAGAELGTFRAVISTASVDRHGDVVEPAALVNAMKAWGPMGKRVPLQWDHKSDADFIIGHVDPASVHEANGEVVVDGWIDQSIDRGAHAWRLVKSGTLGFSYGFLVLDSSPRGGGKGLHIKKIDVFEVTATASPANADTRVLAYKNMGGGSSAVEVERLRDLARRML